MLTYFHLQEVDPDLGWIWISDFQEDECAFLTVDEPGDLFFTLEEHPSVVVGARVAPGQTYIRTLSDLHFYAVDLDRPDRLGPLLVRFRSYEGQLVMPHLSKYIHTLPKSKRIDAHRDLVSPPAPPKPISRQRPIRSQPEPTNVDGGWIGFLRKLPGLRI